MEAGSEAGTVVLVHGGFVDGSGWQGVYSILRKDGYSVSITQHPTPSLEDDAAVVKRAIEHRAGRSFSLPTPMAER
jgi:hypothetical protein